MSPDPLLFAALLAAALFIFGFGCYRRLALISVGQPEDRFDHLGVRLRQVLLHAFAQKQVVSKGFGLNHAVIFWSFLILLLANGEFVVRGLFPELGLALLPAPLHGALIFTFDLVSLATLAAVLLALGRRLFFPPASLTSDYVKARSLDGFLILALIALLMLAYFGLHAAEIAAGREAAGSAMPVSSLLARAFSAETAPDPGAAALFFWWLHAAALLGFLCYLPASKHMHILTAIPNCFFAPVEKPNTVPREEFAAGGSFGVATVDQLSWKDLFDGFSCTECGRCQAACPAAGTGKSLNPRQVIHAIKTSLMDNERALKQGKGAVTPLVGAESEASSTEETVWACTTCGACMSVCPAMIEHTPKIIKLRRHLVQMRAKFPEELLTFFENMEGRSNPWGIAPTERTKWHATLEVKPFDGRDTEYLFFVGCAGAFDSRQKHATVAMAALLDAAGLSWGTLGKDEKCCGDSLRRLGNEFVFDSMARENAALFRDRGVRKVVTQCPHCCTTLKNDYRQYGVELEVIHHSELIADLLRRGKLKLDRQVSAGTVMFHDSCYLGRHNDIYLPPREALRIATGEIPTEFERSGRESFCCGAGGGRMWQEEQHGERINLNRVREAMSRKPDTICVGCPYCMTMLEDGLKDLEGECIKVRDLAELVAEGLGRQGPPQATAGKEIGHGTGADRGCPGRSQARQDGDPGR